MVTKSSIEREYLDDPFFQLASECPVEAWLSVLGHRWSALILYHLRFGPMTFGGLRQRLPAISPKVLSERLKELQGKTLVGRTSPASDARYVLTDSGVGIMPILDAIEVWSRSATAKALEAGHSWGYA